ncbi:hypothetical protein CDD82_5109 [Ophiocordyceps australis]|uniref:Uncharacterized protein n=1 Tax=Ophiocordyceps australis TaxID=1399860 RepID=A0A2C5XIY0_9HYPO|nr:hypothetical protein CDD82_5109 [Ophiocordyceps australis]
MSDQTTNMMTEAEVVQFTDQILDHLDNVNNHQHAMSQQEFLEIGNKVVTAYSHWKDCSENTRHIICRAHIEYEIAAETINYTRVAEIGATVLKLWDLWFENHEWLYENSVNNPFEVYDDDESTWTTTTSESSYTLDMDPYGLRATIEEEDEINMMDELGLGLGMFEA